MSDKPTADEAFPGYRFDPVAAERANRAQAAFRTALLASVPASLFDTEPQLIEATLARLTGEGD